MEITRLAGPNSALYSSREVRRGGKRTKSGEACLVKKDSMRRVKIHKRGRESRLGKEEKGKKREPSWKMNRG